MAYSSNEFMVVMSRCSDEELVQIIHSPAGEYREEAMQAARRELSQRNLTEERHEELERFSQPVQIRLTTLLSDLIPRLPALAILLFPYLFLLLSLIGDELFFCIPLFCLSLFPSGIAGFTIYYKSLKKHLLC